jgi:hypothetical protein
MAEEKEDWLGCPSAVKAALPGKIEKAVAYALDECFLEMVGTPEAQRDKWLYKEIYRRWHGYFYCYRGYAYWL